MTSNRILNCNNNLLIMFYAWIRNRIIFILLLSVISGSYGDLLACQCAKISYSFNRALNKNSTVVYAELLNPENNFDGYSKFKIITDYNNSIENDTISVFTGGTDCTQFFYCEKSCRWIIILYQNFVYNGEIIYSASSCVESALQVDTEENKVIGNITRSNSFIIKILYLLRIYNFPENTKKFDRFDKRLIRKYSTTAQHAV